MYAHQVNAFPNFLTQWQAAYPSSTSSADGVSCQLCHQRSDGGNGWNTYGWVLREAYIDANRVSFSNAISTIQNLDSDGDTTSNLDEINNNQQPGWRAGANNTISCFTTVPANQFCDGGAQLLNQFPPDFSSLIPDRIQLGKKIALETIASGFTAPNLAVPAPGVSDELFVVDQVGIIWRVDVETGTKAVFLDVSNQLITVGSAGFGDFDERGLLGLAFHPDFQNNGLFYTYQSEPVNGDSDFPILSALEIDGGETANHQTVIAEWAVQLPLPAAITMAPSFTAAKRVVLRIDQPQFNHNGGMLTFGSDNALYISLGDGGGSDDEGVGHGADGNAQNANNPLGSILRINPTGNAGTLSANGQYRIPANNPFVADGTRLDEIYAYGLRNVFRFSFDSAAGDLYAGDVGQGDIEEVNFIEAGQNYGWNQKEGSFFFGDSGATATPPDPVPTGLNDPFLEYDHQEGLSVIGGYVYHGADLPDLAGDYIFGDWSKAFNQALGRLFYTEDNRTILEFDVVGGLGLFVNGFGQDATGEMYVVGNTTGTPTGSTGVLRKLVAPVTPINDELCFPIKTQNNRAVIVCL